MPRVAGLHHLTTICSDARRALAFYVGVLGLHLVKRTVTCAPPTVARFYCSTAPDAQGSLIALDVHETAAPGRRGTGQVDAATFAVPAGALAYWQARLAAHGVAARGHAWIFGEQHLCFADPDGLELAIAEDVKRATGGMAQAPVSDTPVAESRVPQAWAIRRIRAIEIALDAVEPTAALLVEGLGLRAAGRDGAVFRFRDGGLAIDLVCAPGTHPGAPGAGIAQHVAWRVADDAALAALRAALAARRIAIGPPLDRHYYRAAAFTAPPGIGFALATDGPGFAIDEPAAQLGRRLCLPPWLEPERAAIARTLPGVDEP